ncbi:MAG: Gfo/Idh/MocA family protein [Gemmataceae bacterium]
MVRIGIVGIGFMGMIHYLGWQRVKGAKVAALCSRDKKKLAGDWRGIRGNFGPPGTIMNVSALDKYPNLEDMLADPAIDMVDICSPTHAHPQQVIESLRAGKHVLVEKCIALDPKDADAMVKAAKKANRLLMVAHVLPFVPEFAYAAEVIRAKTYGKLVAAHFTRVISRPDWSAEIGDAAATGGPAIDLHIHDTHFIGLVCGVPDKVYATGTVEKGSVQYLTTQYLYGKPGKPPAVTCSSGAVAQKGREFIHGFEIYLEKAMLVHDSSGRPLTLFTADGKSKVIKLDGGGDPTAAFTHELQAAVDSVNKKKVHDYLSAQLARDALVMCYKECQSVQTGKAVAV